MADDLSRDDAVLGTAITDLLDGGDEQAAALLLDIVAMRAEFVDMGTPLDGGGDITIFDLTLIAPRAIYDRFTDDVLARISDALRDAAETARMALRRIDVEGELVGEDWRSRAEQRLGQGPFNQAAVAPEPKKWITSDRMRFRDPAELAVYRALCRAQASSPDGDSPTILPNPAARSRIGATWEPDFEVAYRGKVGIIEVDGGTHHGRAAADKSRDRLWEDSGIAYVDRWTVEDTDDAGLDELVARFLRRPDGR